MVDDLKQIKKYYGENMMHLCRELFSTILETPGLLFKLLEDNFNHSKYLYNDIIENCLQENFKRYIYSLIGVDKKEINVKKSPYKLLKEAGYNLYECKTEKDIQKFKKYYSKGEELCTFRGDRLNKCYVFFAVKENIDEIKREDFKKPKRQDEYGTSVISIQFTKGDINTLSIKNRYNHTVNNPDATYSNNLENIIEGLSASFEREYDLNINQNSNSGFEIPGYVKANDGKYYKYNYEINNIYYCPNNIIIDNFEVIRKYQEKEKYLILDYFILDLANKKIMLYDIQKKDSFIDGLLDIKNIEINKEKETGNKHILIIPNIGKEIKIKIDKYGRIIEYENENLEQIGDNFLKWNETLECLKTENVKNIGDNALLNNKKLMDVYFPEVILIGNNFMYYNMCLQSVYFPKLIKIKNNFLHSNIALNQIQLPSLIQVQNNFIYWNEIIEIINFPKLELVGNFYLANNLSLKNMDLKNLKIIGNNFLPKNKCITSINFPNLVKIGSFFLTNNYLLSVIELKELEEVGDEFLTYNRSIECANFPLLKKVGHNFLRDNSNLKSISFPQLEEVGHNFMCYNKTMEKMYVEKLKIVGNSFLSSNQLLQNTDFKNIENYGDDFLGSNKKLKYNYLIDYNNENILKKVKKLFKNRRR